MVQLLPVFIMMIELEIMTKEYECSEAEEKQNYKNMNSDYKEIME